MSASVLRRLVFVVSVAAAAAVLVNWWRQRDDTAVDREPPEWPAWPSDPATTGTPAVPDTPASPGAPARAVAAAGAEAVGTAAAVGAGAAAWVAGSDGDAPDGYPIKLNENSGIFHVPGGRFYERTRADRWYATAQAAVADGYRQSKT